MKWEITYIDLYLGGFGDDVRPLSEVKEEIARLGQEGWEPVGQVEFREGSGGQVTVYRQLMLKRAVGTGSA